MRTFQTSRLLLPVVLGLMVLWLGACGGSTKTSGQSSSAIDTAAARAPNSAQADPDGDEDSLPSTGGARAGRDSDDRSVLDLGHAADAADKASISSLVRLYYRAATSENGMAACAMLYSPYAESVPDDYGTSPPGPAYARGTTCPAVMTLVFKHFHSELAARMPTLKVSRVRLIAHQGIAILSFGANMPERELHVAREGHTWRVVGLVDNLLP